MTSGEIRTHLQQARRELIRAEQLRDRFAREMLLAQGRIEAFERLLADIEKSKEPEVPPMPPNGIATEHINGAAPAA